MQVEIITRTDKKQLCVERHNNTGLEYTVTDHAPFMGEGVITVDLQEQEGLYHYVIPSLTDSEISWTSFNSPDEVKSNWMRILTSLGVDNEHLRNFVVYVKTEGNMWRPLVGQTASEAVLFPIAIQAQEDIEFLEPEFLRLGKQLVAAYTALQTKRVELSRGLSTDKKREFLDDVENKIKLIDAAVAGTGDLAKVFDLWARKRYKKSKCARAMLMSERTWARRCRDAAVHIAKELTRNLSLSEVQSLLAESNGLTRGEATR